MKFGHASRTAQAAAAIRANHYLYTNQPVFSDPYAFHLTSPIWRRLLSNRTFIKALNSKIPNQTFGLLTAQVVARSRYAEDQLEMALQQGIKQYVLIGAGLDSFVLRLAQKYSDIKVFEVDHPDTQALKIQSLQKLGHVPDHVEFVSIDFEKENLAHALKRSSYNIAQPAFFSWLGTTHYLNPETTFSTLQTIAEFAVAGSELVLDYSIPYQDLTGLERVGSFAVSKFTYFLSEPIIGTFHSDELHRAVSRLGYVVLEDLSAHDITQRYFANRKDGIRHTQATHLLHLKRA
ncbi:class I SAM-dependent methyltransferase [Acinetobacter gandensis]|uniref:S-adenosyl-L-methionine-dependent methyltransferase n=1 Tax=Acinetobacter gandensis TaxID=1443941 RepID=A0A1A7RCB6_9GAMM|nr:class I SAM-dependent methyltransferase [Acinetobacter gandensis]KAB0630349.1 class I SAM-dependent methyltransferase [Acinetobacter gandensis]OBX28352.1 transferase [Acinetobacter gandensis]